MLRKKRTLREKCPDSELFWSECGKTQTRITPNTDTFHAVLATFKLFRRNLSTEAIFLNIVRHQCYLKLFELFF